MNLACLGDRGFSGVLGAGAVGDAAAQVYVLHAIGLGRRSLFGCAGRRGAAVGLAGGVVGAALKAAMALLGGDLGAGISRGCGRSLVFQPGVTVAYVLAGVLAVARRGPGCGRGAATVAYGPGVEGRRRAALADGVGPPRLGGRPAAGERGGLPHSAAGRLAGGWLPGGGLPAGRRRAAAAGAGGGHRPPAAKGGPVPARLARRLAAPGHAVVAAAGR